MRLVSVSFPAHQFVVAVLSPVPKHLRFNQLTSAVARLLVVHDVIESEAAACKCGRRDSSRVDMMDAEEASRFIRRGARACRMIHHGQTCQSARSRLHMSPN